MKRSELHRLMKDRLNVRMHFSQSAVAASLSGAGEVVRGTHHGDAPVETANYAPAEFVPGQNDSDAAPSTRSFTSDAPPTMLAPSMRSSSPMPRFFAHGLHTRKVPPAST